MSMKHKSNLVNGVITITMLMLIDRAALRLPRVTFSRSLGCSKWQCEVCDSLGPSAPLSEIDRRPALFFPRLVTRCYWQAHWEKLTGHTIHTASWHFSGDWMHPAVHTYANTKQIPLLTGFPLRPRTAEGCCLTNDKTPTQTLLT